MLMRMMYLGVVEVDSFAGEGGDDDTSVGRLECTRDEDAVP